ncbi:hypothetical protein GCM10020331_076640 [Ectobacillus funiculus]
MAGDTVWYEAIQEVIDTHQPEVIVVNGGDNQFLQGGSLVMGKHDIYEVSKAAPNAKKLFRFIWKLSTIGHYPEKN